MCWAAEETVNTRLHCVCLTKQLVTMRPSQPSHTQCVVHVAPPPPPAGPDTAPWTQETQPASLGRRKCSPLHLLAHV